MGDSQGQLSFATTSAYARGSFVWDLDHDYSLRWPSWQDFETWRQKEQRNNGIEFVRKNIRKAGAGLLWKERHEFVCARQGAGSVPKYAPKNPNRKRNVPSKRSGCPCRLTIKTYTNSSELLGMYSQEHAHQIGDENLRFTQLSKEVRDEISHLLRLGIENDRIVCEYFPN
jgi:hypothetical protein